MTGWLIDKSALARVSRCADPHVWLERMQGSQVHIAGREPARDRLLRTLAV